MPVRDGSGIAVVRTCAGCAEVHKKAIVSRGLLYAAVLLVTTTVFCALVSARLLLPERFGQFALKLGNFRLRHQQLR
jgi:hypothetical protein